VAPPRLRHHSSPLREQIGSAIGHINPWPDGAFAKVAWQQVEPDEKGGVRTGAFIQVAEQQTLPPLRRKEEFAGRMLLCLFFQALAFDGSHREGYFSLLGGANPLRRK